METSALEAFKIGPNISRQLILGKRLLRLHWISAIPAMMRWSNGVNQQIFIPAITPDLSLFLATTGLGSALRESFQTLDIYISALRGHLVYKARTLRVIWGLCLGAWIPWSIFASAAPWIRISYTRFLPIMEEPCEALFLNHYMPSRRRPDNKRPLYLIN